MKTLGRRLLLGAAVLLAGLQAQAAAITLFDHALKQCGRRRQPRRGLLRRCW